jgi:hypothetical protein
VPKEEVLKKFPPEYYEFIKLFLPKEADELPPHRPFDHKLGFEAWGGATSQVTTNVGKGIESLRNICKTTCQKVPILIIRETLDALCNVEYYTKLDIIAARHSTGQG